MPREENLFWSGRGDMTAAGLRYGAELSRHLGRIYLRPCGFGGDDRPAFRDSVTWFQCGEVLELLTKFLKCLPRLPAGGGKPGERPERGGVRSLLAHSAGVLSEARNGFGADEADRFIAMRLLAALEKVGPGMTGGTRTAWRALTDDLVALLLEPTRALAQPQVEAVPDRDTEIVWRNYADVTLGGRRGILFFHGCVMDAPVARIRDESALLYLAKRRHPRYVRVDLLVPSADRPVAMLPRELVRYGQFGQGAKEAADVLARKKPALFFAHERLKDWEASLGAVKDAVRTVLREGAFEALRRCDRDGRIWALARL